MMSISPVVGDAGYYSEQDNYYASGSMNSRWAGKGADKLGLSGEVREAAMDQIRQGVLPDGTQLSRIENGRETHRTGYDLTFSAPKSVSVLALIGDDARFTAAHNAAVQVAMKEVESLVSARITRNKQTITVMTGNMVAALYNHDTSRALDPQLHTHALVFNATYAQGKWRSLASDTRLNTGFSETVMANQVALGNIYRQVLRQSVESMGFKTHDSGKNGLWEITGVPVEAFSQRTQVIQAQAGEGASLKSRDVAALDTRQAKVAKDPQALRGEWRERLQVTGFDTAAFIREAAERAGQRNAVATPEQVADVTQAVSTAVFLLSDRQVQFTYSEVLAKTVGQLPAVPGVFAQARQGIEAAIENQQLLPLDKEKGLFTSSVHLLNELGVQQLARSLLQENRVLTFPQRSQERRGPYSDVYSVLAQEKSPLAVLSGQGGAQQQRERIAEAFIMAREQGRDVSVLSADKRSEAFLQQENSLSGGVLPRSHLSESLTLPSQSTLVVEQAEKLTLAETRLLLEKSQSQGVQLLLMNTGKRTGTGSALAVLQEAGVTEYRFYDRPATKVLLVSEPDRQQRYAQLARDYAALKTGGTAVVAQVTGPREQASLTAAIRTQLQAGGQLGTREQSLAVLTPVWLDRQIRHQRDSYREGMVMEQWDREAHVMHRWQIDRVNADTHSIRLRGEDGQMRVEKINQLDSRWSLFRRQSVPVAVGEQMRVTGRELNGQLKAGDALTITGTGDNTLTVQCGKQALTLSTARALKLAPDYVESHGARTGQQTQVLAAVGARELNQATLSQLSRSGENVTLYTPLPAGRAEQKLARCPHILPVTAQLKAQAGTPDLSQALAHHRESLFTPAQQAVALGLGQVQGRRLAFSDAALITAAVSSAPGVPVSAVKAEITRQQQQGELITLPPLPGTGSGLQVSRATFELEKSILHCIAEGKNAVTPLMQTLPDNTLDGLTPGQKTATTLILQSPDRFVAIQGFAGTGKTTQFKAVMDAITNLPEAQRPQVTGLAPTHRAVSEMQAAGVQAQTLASFLHEARQHDIIGAAPDWRNQLFLVDESSMVGNREMAELYQRIAQGGGRAVCSGDSAQLQAIEPGQPFRLQQQRSAIDTAVMQDIVRQTPALKPAIISMTEGNAREALARVEAVTPAQIPREAGAWQPASSVTEFGPDRDITEAISLDYTGRMPQARHDTLIVAHLNADRHTINRRIHNALLQAGELHSTTSLSVLEPVRTLLHELRNAQGFVEHVGKVAVMDSQYYTVAQADTDNGVVTLRDSEGQTRLISCAENSTQTISLYQPRRIEVSVGDKMRFTRSDTERGYVANSQWEISSTDNGQLTLTAGTLTRQIDPGKVAEDRHIDLAYAVTAYGAQGASARYVIALEGVSGSRKAMATQEGGYVTLSRAREHVQVYTDDREGWLTALEQQTKRYSAHDLLLHAGDKSAQVADRLMSTAMPLQDNALGRQLLRNSGLAAGDSMARFIAPGRQYPAPHLALPVWDSHGRRAGVYLDEVKLNSNNTDIRLRHAPRVTGSDDARFAGLQASRNGETRLAADIPAGFRLAQAYPDSGIIVRLSGDGIPHNIQRITGGILVPDDETVRQADRPPDDPVPFIPDEAHKRAEELEKKAQAAIAQRPETEKQDRAIEKVSEAGQHEKDDRTLKMLTDPEKSKDDEKFDTAIRQVTQSRIQERLQHLERDVVKEKTFGE